MGREQLSSLYARGNWHQFPRALLFLMPVAEAILLSFLINKSDISDCEEDAQGWFQCSMKYVMAKMNIPFRQQVRLFSSLEKKGYIRTKLIGFPCKRLVRVEFEFLDQKVQEQFKKARAKKRAKKR